MNKEEGLTSPMNGENKNREKINLAGIGNAAIANIATDTLRGWFTSEAQKPATKADLKKMISESKNRFQIISNIPKRVDGSKAYFDNQTQKVVYLKPKSNW